MASEDTSGSKDLGVYELITDLCRKVSSKYSTHNRISQQNLTANMRSLSYEIILKKSSKDIPLPKGEPIVNLLSYYFISQQNAKNVAEYKKCAELKKIINTIRQQDCNENKELIHNVLRLLVALSDTVKEDASREMYQRPFSFGLHNEMLPRPERESFGSPQPYPYYPGHVFELPFSLRRESPVLNNPRSQTYTEYTVESFDSRSYLPESSIGHSGVDVRTFRSPMSLPSLASTHLYPFTEGVLSPNYPRLLAPRDLKIPTSSDMSSNVKVSFASTSFGDLKEVFKTNSDDCTVDIWEIASQIDKDIPEDIWDVASKLPPIRERQLIAASSREMTLWRQKYRGELSELNIISERQFIRHIMYLLIGVETNSFHFNKEFQRFYMRDDLILECISKEHIRRYISDLLLIGTYYWRLFNFAFNQSLTDNFYSQGLVYEAAREVIRKYLLEFRISATKIYEECIKNNAEYIGCMPTLLQILFHVEPLKNEIETIASIYKMINSGDKTVLPHGAELMSYLFNEMSLVTHRSTSVKVFDSLFSICKVYFKFIEKFIFEGELDDRYNEFFIKKDSSYVNIRSKRYWDKGFHIIQSVAIPEFLRTLSKFILLCGKSLRLLRLCNPSDPLVLLISSDHPSIKCCASFEELERQQQVLDVYRTRCLFVSGEPVTFDQILLKREAEKKAFTEIAALKQAETLEKIVAERKRLAQLIIAEKQHSLRVLEAAMAEAKAAKTLSKMREKRLCDLEKTAEKATEEVDSKLVDSEKNRIMEYYSKLNMAVEKSKIHTEWKIKRLQLDQSRIQLLSTEERNLKREKLELEHQKNEEIMAMSIQSIEPTSEDGNECHGDGEINKEQDEAEIVKAEVEKISFDLNKDKAQSSSDVFSAICNVAQSFFGGSKSNDVCDNKKDLDNQGNEIPSTMETNKNVENKTSNAEIGRKLDNAYDNLQFLKLKQDATSNKQKVMSHEFGQTDNENNQVKIPVIKIDDQNNVPHEWTPQEAAKRNKLKVLGDEFGLGKPEEKIVVEPKTDAQKEALRNKLKVLGVEYNLPAEATIEKEPANEAQGDAIRNKKKVLASEYETRLGEMSSKRSIAKRSGLTLNLKPYVEDNVQSIGNTPNTGALTPGEFFPRLDLETPTTADIPPEGPITCDLYTPKSECENDLEHKAKSEKELLSSDGFNFSLIVDEETVDSEAISETPDGSPSKTITEIKQFKPKTSVFNLLDGSYSLADMDPFGIKELTGYSQEQFSNKMDYDMSNSCYTHPAVIMEEVKKPPYANIFASHLAPEDDKESISCDNIATLSACLQRSVMLPLTYQLEVVNNSILTFFLVNLDMYEHLRSFKDYFFLMDGEFSRSICHNLFTKLTKTLNPQELLNYATLHNILDKALGSSISHVHKFSENLSFTITDSPLSFQHSSPDVLQCLSLTYSVDWPLNILLSQEALSRYAKVFQFLLKMRRIFWVLGEDFEALKLSVKLSKQHSRKLLRSQQYISIQIYRHMMASLIRALDNYIVTTCILTSWREFENDLKKARTLDDLYECHVVYIKKVLFRCLLNNRSTPVMKLLNDIFTVILKFSRVLKAGDWQQNEPSGYFTHSNFSQLQDLFHLFEKLAKYLHKVVTKLMECGYQRHLVELLTMINLNGHYNPDKSKEHNTSVVSVASLPA